MSGTHTLPRSESTGRLSYARQIVVIVLVFSVSIASFAIYYAFASDRSSDSIAGLLYGIIGTGLLLFGLLHYTRLRRTRQRYPGQLFSALRWHMAWGLLSLLLIFFHSFGHFNPRSGTYALYALLALVISGVIGRFLDRRVPRLIAYTVSQTLTNQGEDRLEHASQTNTMHISAHQSSGSSLSGIVQPEIIAYPLNQEGKSLPAAWDMAYHTPDQDLQVLTRNTAQQLQSRYTMPPVDLAVPPLEGAEVEARRVARALRREHYYRALLRSWRVFHLLLAALTCALLLWHIIYACLLILPLLRVN